MPVSVKPYTATLKRLVGEYLDTHADAAAARLTAFTTQNGISDAEVKAQFDDSFDHQKSSAPAASKPPVLDAESVPSPAPAPMPARPPAIHAVEKPDLGRDLASLAGHFADLFNPVSQVGEAVYDAAKDAMLGRERAAGAAWLKARGIGPAQQQEILKVISGAEFWHGTGRFQYANAGDSKYDGVTDKVVDKLGQIIDAGGLKPQYDAYYASGARGGDSISMASSHMYARYYAELHQSAEHDLQYQFGTAGEWESMMGAHLAVSGLGEVVLGHAFGSQPTVQSWARTVSRSPDFNAVVDGDQRSDIKDNYAVLFGVRRGAVHTVEFPSRMNRIEARTDAKIPFDEMTHVEVPARDVAATEKMLRDRGIALPVLAMEDVEAVLSRFSASQLVNNTLAGG